MKDIKQKWSTSYTSKMLNIGEKQQSPTESKIQIDWNRTEESPERNIKNQEKKKSVPSKLIYTVIMLNV